MTAMKKRKPKDVKVNIRAEKTHHRNIKQQANPYIIMAVLSSFLIINKINCEGQEISNPSTILYEFSKAVLEFSSIEEETRETLLEKPIKALIKSQLDPIQEQFPSFNVRITKLEKMEIPRTAVPATIEELEALGKKIYLADTLFNQIVNASNLKRVSVNARSANIFKFKKKIDDMYNSEEENTNFLLLLEFDGLNFEPPSISDEELLEMEMRNMTFSKTAVFLEEAGYGPKVLAAKLLELSKLISRREELFKGTEEGFKAMGAKDYIDGYHDPVKIEAISTDPVFIPHLEEQFQVCSEIVERIEEDGEFLNLTVRFLVETERVIDYWIKEVIESGVNVQLYLHIRNNVMDELNLLKMRIEKLEDPRVQVTRVEL